jgi:hypothetical protein
MAVFVLAAPAAQGNEAARWSAFDSLTPTGAVSLAGGLSAATAADQTLAESSMQLISASDETDSAVSQRDRRKDVTACAV